MRRVEQRNVSKDGKEAEATREHGAGRMRLSIRMALTLDTLQGRIADVTMILLENVTKEYDLPTGQTGALVAADRLTLEVPDGEVFGLVGPNGAGKTTTLKMICGLMLPTAGRITVNKIDVELEPEGAQQYPGYLADFFIGVDR